VHAHAKEGKVRYGMTTKDMQHLVHTLVQQETSALQTGLFADEKIRNFYVEVKTLINECFQSLYDLVQQNYINPQERQMRFDRGLEFFSNPETERISADEMRRALVAFPSISTEYQLSMIRYAQTLHGNMVGTLSLKIPSFEKFLFQLYKRIAATLEVRSMRYFSMSYLEQDIFLRDVVRLAMKSCMSMHEPENLDAGHIRPSDSVSNIAGPRPKSVGRNGGGRGGIGGIGIGGVRRGEPSVVSSLVDGMMRAVEEDHYDRESDVQSLTAMSLQRHKETVGPPKPRSQERSQERRGASASGGGGSVRSEERKHLPDDAPSVFLSKRRPNGRHSNPQTEIGTASNRGRPAKSVRGFQSIDDGRSELRVVDTGDQPDPNPKPQFFDTEARSNGSDDDE